jgi:hypothetical protein
MTQRTNLVNLDAMITRADFATEKPDGTVFENVSTISVRDFTKGGLIGPSLRKPDFQRETNHWSPEQVVSLLECFINGDLIPSVILWQSPTYLFVIDGGHRLSVLQAWINDDYGDGPISQKFFGYQIPNNQKKSANRTRILVDSKIGTWQHIQARIEDQDLSETDRKLVNAVVSRGLPIQWVKGNPDKAADSFFKINTKGTPLDDVEELLLKNRKSPISIAARAVIRAGKGHCYWSAYSIEIQTEIEDLSQNLHHVLFEPELEKPVKTLDLPLGGSQGVRTALQILIDLMIIANKNQEGKPKTIEDYNDDIDGSKTIEILRKSLKLARRITGNDAGSLGLHPAVYFYGPTGRHSGPLFMGTVALFGKKLTNNDPTFFIKFTQIRERLECILLEYKDLIATIIQKHVSSKRVDKYFTILEGIIDSLLTETEVNENKLVDLSGLQGKIVTGSSLPNTQKFSDDVKSKVFISTALKTSIKCPICQGYLDPTRSVSYDHIRRVRENGEGIDTNCQLTHPFCNQSIRQ